MELKILNYTVKQYIDDIASGEIKIPTFQRDYCWKPKQVCYLLDSILRGFPIGNVVLWKSNDELDFVKNYFDYTVQERNTNFSLILDGQQRSLSLFGCFYGNQSNDFDFKNICIDVFDLLNIENNKETNIFKFNKRANKRYISVFSLLSEETSEIKKIVSKNFSSEDKDKLMLVVKELIKIGNKIKNYQLSVTESKCDNILDAPIIFENINITGKKLYNEDIIYSKLFINDSDLDSTFEFEKYLDSIRNLFNSFWVKNSSDNNLTNNLFEDKDLISIISQSITKKSGKPNIKLINIEKMITHKDKVKEGIIFANKYIKDYFKINNFDDIPKFKFVYKCLIIFYISNDLKYPSIQQIKNINHIILGSCILKDNMSNQKINEDEMLKEIVKISKNEQINKFKHADFKLLAPSILNTKSRVTDSVKALNILTTLDTSYNQTNGLPITLDLETKLNKIYLNYKIPVEELFCSNEENNKNIIENCLQNISLQEISTEPEIFTKKRLDNLGNKFRTCL